MYNLLQLGETTSLPKSSGILKYSPVSPVGTITMSVHPPYCLNPSYHESRCSAKNFVVQITFYPQAWPSECEGIFLVPSSLSGSSQATPCNLDERFIVVRQYGKAQAIAKRAG